MKVNIPVLESIEFQWDYFLLFDVLTLPLFQLSCPISEADLVTRHFQYEYLQPVITQYFASNKSEIWS